MPYCVGGIPRLVIAMAVLLAAACGSRPDAGEEASRPSPAAFEPFANSLDRLRVEHRIPGLSAAVVLDQQLVWSAGFGVANVETRTPATSQTPYDIASVTKPLSAVVALALAERGVVDLDRPMAEYSQWLEFCQAFSQQPSIFARDLRCDPPVHTLRHLLTHTATGVPGERFSYNPVLFSWGSRPLMAVTGEPFSSIVPRLVFEPAGMTRSARRYRDLALPPHLAAALAPPHREDDAGNMQLAPPLEAQGDGAAGGIISNVDDLARFDIALDRGTLISPGSREAMMTPATNPTGDPLPYGLGWYVQTYEGRTLVWHSGWWENAYSALYLKVPSASATLILLANSEGLWWGNPLDAARVHESPFAQAFLRWLDEFARR